MSTINDEYELEPAHFPRKEKSGFILGLDIGPGVAVLILVGMAVASSFVLPFPFGALLGLGLLPIAGFVGWTRWKGLHLFDWIKLGASHGLRKLTGQDDYLRPSPHADEKDEAKAQAKADRADAKAAAEAEEWDEPVPPKTQKPIKLHLPGAANELKLYVGPNGHGIIHNPLRKRLTVTAVLNNSNFTLKDDPEKAEVLNGWASILDVVGGHYEVEAVIPSDMTTVVSGQQMADFYVSSAEQHGAGARRNPVAHAGYLELLKSSPMTKHPQYLTVNLSVPRLKTEIKANGSGVAGMLKTAEARLAAIEDDLSANGFKVDHWVGVEERKRLCHEALTGITDESEGTGGAVVGARVYWDRMRVDDMWHRAFIVQEWPLKPAQQGFLEKLIFAGQFRHSVTLVHRRGDDEKALRDASNHVKDAENAEDLSLRTGRRVSQEMRREKADLERIEEELVAGSSDVRFQGFLSVTADSVDKLEQHSRDLYSAAARANMRIRPCFGQQFQGLLAATGQLGFGAD